MKPAGKLTLLDYSFSVKQRLRQIMEPCLTIGCIWLSFAVVLSLSFVTLALQRGQQGVGEENRIL